MRGFDPYDEYQVYEELVQAIDPAVFARYLAGSGWRSIPTKRKGVAIYQSFHDGELAQANIPFNRDFRDYGWGLYRAVQETAHHEDRPISQLLLTLLYPHADILFISTAGPGVEPGAVPLNTVVSLHESLRDLLAASARDVLSSGQPDAVQTLIRHCLVGRTERGSWIGPLVCPFLDEDGDPYTPQSVWDHADICARSLTRRAMRHLMEGMHALCAALDAGSRPEIPVSTDFCRTLAGICSQCGAGSVHVQAQWSPAVRESITAVSVVRLTGEDAAPLQAIAARLRCGETGAGMGNSVASAIQGVPFKPTKRQ